MRLLCLIISLDFLAVLFIMLRSKFGGNLAAKGGDVAEGRYDWKIERRRGGINL